MTLSTICLPIQNELKEVEATLLNKTASQVPLITTAAQYVLQNGGKRIRPALCLLTSKLLGFTGEKSPLLGAAIEMIHAASLMHDDVLDNATLRRGKPAANVKWGNQVSILVGDFLWCRASEIVIIHGNERILSAITYAVEKTTEGEILEIVKSNDFSLTEDEYINTITLKTAMLFACAAKIGAIAANASEKFETALQNFGLNLGIAFQLSDDVLDYTANETNFGKKTGTDLCEGRLTLPIILALKKCNSKEASIIKDALLANSPDTGRLAEVSRILKNNGTISESLKVAQKYAKLAKEGLLIFKPSIEKESLEMLADYSVLRSE